MTDLTIFSNAALISIIYGLMELYKLYFAKENEKLVSFIPVIAGVLGAILGVSSFYIAPDILAAASVLDALLIGAASGLVSVGVNQIGKQLTSSSTNTSDTTNEE